MKYYTYAYLRENGTPYYIGKGSGGRINNYHSNFVKVPPVERRLLLKRFLLEEEAYQHEIYMISVYGRKDIGTGILINRTPGGDKPPRNNKGGWNKGMKMSFTEERGKRISEALKGKTKSVEHRKNLSQSAKGRIPSNIKTYEFIDSNGKCVIVDNLRKFSQENNLTYSTMGKLTRGEIKKHRGYRYVRTLDKVAQEVPKVG